jgi:hypothetical protein
MHADTAVRKDVKHADSDHLISLWELRKINLQSVEASAAFLVLSWPYVSE